MKSMTLSLATVVAGAIHRECPHLDHAKLEELVTAMHEEYYKNIPWKM